jgi:nucleotide-binding universal stress UspA family protein
MEKKIKKIIVACDCSDYSAEIFAYAVEVALGLKAELIVTNVVNRVELDRLERVLGAYASFSIQEYIEARKAERKELIEKLIQDTGHPELFKRVVYKIGIPFLELIDSVKLEEADLMIMGNKGRGNLAGVLLGSCAEKMFRRCPVALLMVRVGDQKRIL